METERISLDDLFKLNEDLNGIEFRFGNSEPWVKILKMERDRFGWDVLYQEGPLGSISPRWRGFDNGDTVEMRRV